MGILVIWVFAPLFMVVVRADEGFYMNEGANKGYTEDSVITQLENITLVQCLLQCRLRDDCKYTAFHNAMKVCGLLKVTNFTNGGKNGEHIYSLVETRPGMYITCDSELI